MKRYGLSKKERRGILWLALIVGLILSVMFLLHNYGNSIDEEDLTGEEFFYKEIQLANKQEQALSDSVAISKKKSRNEKKRKRTDRILKKVPIRNPLVDTISMQ